MLQNGGHYQQKLVWELTLEPDTDWFKETTQTAVSQVHNFSMSGGVIVRHTELQSTTVMLKVLLINTGYSQINGRINMTQKALNDKFTLDLNLGATDKEAQYGFSDAFRYATIYNPTAPVRSSDPALCNVRRIISNRYFMIIIIPFRYLKQNINDGKDRIINLSLRGSYELTKGLTIDAFYSLQGNTALRGRYYDKNSYWVGRDTERMSNRSRASTTHPTF